MNRVFTIAHPERVPDGTIVYPFLNPKDSASGLPWGLLDGCSIAAGDIEPHGRSTIQVLPLATQVTFVLHGALHVRIKDREAPAPYTVPLLAEQAAVQRPGAFFQLINPTDTVCRVLYIVSPPFVFEKEGEDIRYDDAIALDLDWQALATLNWQLPAELAGRVTPEARQAALNRLARRPQRA